MTVHGFVQGVFFRLNTLKKAKELNISGWVRNNDDGTVEIVAQGDSRRIKELIEFCNKGPASARVEKVDLDDEPIANDLTDFRILY